MIPHYLDLRNCDNMELMAQYPDKYFDLAIVDPPYNIASQQNGRVGSRIDKSGKMNGWNNKIPNKEYFDMVFRISSGQIVWGANNFIMPPSEYFCIWNKHQTVDNFASAEYAWVSPSLKKPAKVFDMGIHAHNSSIDRIHPTQKPVQLYKWLLKHYAKPGDKILDTHLGSMSIAIAVHEMNKQGMNLSLVGCELDAEYYREAMCRVELHCKQQSLF